MIADDTARVPAAVAAQALAVVEATRSTVLTIADQFGADAVLKKPVQPQDLPYLVEAKTSGARQQRA
jgi:hypothetical protein